jgi:hypothetical protein
MREASGVWWWYLILGIAWIWYGTFVLSYRVGGLAAVAGLVGVAFRFGGVGIAETPTPGWTAASAGSPGRRPLEALDRHRRGPDSSALPNLAL